MHAVVSFHVRGATPAAWVRSAVGRRGRYVSDLFASMGGGPDDGKLNIRLGVIWKTNGTWAAAAAGNGTQIASQRVPSTSTSAEVSCSDIHFVTYREPSSPAS
ncbi:hypothetical protein I35_4980 [Burkholderia cenocepacia H111]|nr:hypothetical protein I35_4980 [Burkholderia cenocepacia H111]